MVLLKILMATTGLERVLSGFIIRYANMRNRNAIIVERSSCSFKSMQDAYCWPSAGHTCYPGQCHERGEKSDKALSLRKCGELDKCY